MAIRAHEKSASPSPVPPPTPLHLLSLLALLILLPLRPFHKNGLKRRRQNLRWPLRQFFLHTSRSISAVSRMDRKSQTPRSLSERPSRLRPQSKLGKWDRSSHSMGYSTWHCCCQDAQEILSDNSDRQFYQVTRVLGTSSLRSYYRIDDCIYL